MINVLVVDDHALIRKGLKMLLEDTPDIRVAGEADSGVLALKMARENQYDLVLLDISLPDKMGTEVLKQLRLEHPYIRVIVLSMFPDDEYGVRALKAGAMGYINKQSAPEQLIGAIQQVIKGKKYISESLAEQLLSNLMGANQELPHHALSNREFQTLCLMASGKTLTEIAETMLLSPKTVSVYRSRMRDKMGFRNNADAIRYAITHRLIDTQD